MTKCSPRARLVLYRNVGNQLLFHHPPIPEWNILNQNPYHILTFVNVHSNLVQTSLAIFISSKSNFCIFCGTVISWLKEENVLFNDAFNTFYLWLYSVEHMVKDHSDSERGNLLPPLYGQLISITSKGSFICIAHKQDNTYHGLCYTSCGALAGTRNSSMGPPWRIDLTTHRVMSKCSYH